MADTDDACSLLMRTRNTGKDYLSSQRKTMKQSHFPLVLIFSLLFAVVSIVVAAQENDDVKLANAIVDWVRREGGYFSHKLKIGRLNDDPSNPLGVFCSQDIQAKERLLEVPHSCFISLWDEAESVEDDDEDEAFYHNVCHLAQKLALELKLGKDSYYEPFIEYVKHQRQGQIPATWSDEGKQVLGQVLFKGSDVVDWMKLHFDDCNVEDHVLALTVQRGYDTALIPVWDLFNHRNGDGLNTENDPMYDHDALKVRASRDLKKGEEVFATYNECEDCIDTRWYWGTPEILRDFGFVESFPQRWIFEDYEIWFEIDEDDNGELDIEWDIGEDGYGVPDEEGIAFMKKELKRLQEIDMKEQGKVPEYEWNSIKQYHEAAMTAISKAIESAVAYESNEEL